MIVDHRAPLADGDEAQTKFEFLREVLLTLTNFGEELDDPVWITAVDENGIMARREPSLTCHQYQSVRTQLQELTPTGTERKRRHANRSPSRAGHAGPVLHGDRTVFDETLRLYFVSLQTDIDRVKREHPLRRGQPRKEHR